MGSFHGAETCDLIGLYNLKEITHITGANRIGIYRDYGLGVIKQSNGTNIEEIYFEKTLRYCFSDHHWRK